MTRIAIIVQRYGLEINGGAELHARLLANALRDHYEVEILSSRALDYQCWDRHYPAGEQLVQGLRVIRFDHPPKDRSRRKHMPLSHKIRFLTWKWLANFGIAPVAKPSGDDTADGVQYLVAQGPTMPGLLEHLRRHANDYQALIFITARFYPTALGVLIDPARSILVPTLHPEKTMALPHFQRVFRAPRRIMFNTSAEWQVARRLYGDDIAPGEVCGVGIDIPEPTATANVVIPGVDCPYLLYVGRVDQGKGCGELFDYFERLRQRWPTESLKLIVCGRWFMAQPSHPDIVSAGFVSDAERDVLIAGALALVVPSRHESLSLAMLEGLAAGCPVIVNWHSEVLRQHVLDSAVGATYRNANEFAQAVWQQLRVSDAIRRVQAEQGRNYVRDNYHWPAIVAKFRRAIDTMPAAAMTPEPDTTNDH